MISGSSIINAVAAYSIAMVFVCVLRKWTGFLKRGGVPVLLLLAAFASLRLILPIEIAYTYAVQSWGVLGETLKFFRTYPVITQLLLVVWSAGAVTFVKNDVVELRRAEELRSSYTIVESVLVRRLVEELSIDCPVIVSPDVEIPYVAGIFRHTIYLPVLELPKEKIRLILLHEVQHIRNHDSLIKLFFELLSAVMWWNPVAQWFRRELDPLLEMYCDAKVTKHMNGKERYMYGEVLKAVAKQVVDNREMAGLGLSKSLVTGKTNVLTQRMELFLRPAGRVAQFIRIAAQCVVVVVFCASYLIIFQPAIAPLEEEFLNDSETYYLEDEADSIIDEEIYSSFIVKESDGRYKLCINYEFSRYLTEEQVASDQYKDLYIFEEDK